MSASPDRERAPAPGLPDFEDVLRARDAVAKHLHRTPLLHYPGLSRLLDAEVRVKHEDHHAAGAFKVRGGVYLATLLAPEERGAGLFTASTGNHGFSVAFAGQVTGTPVTVAVPLGANAGKVAAMRDLGATVVHHGADYDEARVWMAAEADRRGGRFIGPTDPELIAGVATYALEIIEDWPEVEVVVVPVGAGSGACGVCIAGKHLKPDLEVIAVQAEGAPTVQHSWTAKRPIEAPMRTRAEGLATRVPHANALAVLDAGLDDFLLVSDAELEEAIRTYYAQARSVAEHAGAAALAGAMQIRERLAGRRVALVLSGRNLVAGELARILSEGDAT